MKQSSLESIKPDTAKMMETEQSGRVKGVILTTRGDPDSGYHFVSRYFAPWNGIPEDPVTGITLVISKEFKFDLRSLQVRS